MMNAHRIFGMKVRKPPEPETQRTTRLFRLFQVLMETLQRDNCKAVRRHLCRLAHHLFLVRAIAMQRNEQRRRRPAGGVQIVIDFDLGFESSFYALGSFGAGHLPQAYSRYGTTSDSLSHAGIPVRRSLVSLLCSLCLCGESLLPLVYHRDTENTEVAQRDTPLVAFDSNESYDATK